MPSLPQVFLFYFVVILVLNFKKLILMVCVCDGLSKMLQIPQGAQQQKDCAEDPLTVAGSRQWVLRAASPRQGPCSSPSGCRGP